MTPSEIAEKPYKKYKSCYQGLLDLGLIPPFWKKALRMAVRMGKDCISSFGSELLAAVLHSNLQIEAFSRRLKENWMRVPTICEVKTMMKGILQLFQRLNQRHS
ncbi:hypothetical protein AVEN_33254-1 [Araneus ventricosus]|uniref:Uncharacterized protein n=1 Tax=Araneus ventricosus TaxID=182803 RepID=A0A4Y2J809_ARAVE|nr:hypothetical protein AVEN_33254-1 [Araneus ventricosus]